MNTNKETGIFRGWGINNNQDTNYGFIDMQNKKIIFLHKKNVSQNSALFINGSKVSFIIQDTEKGFSALNACIENQDDELEEFDPYQGVNHNLIEELSTWKREAKSEDSHRYFYHINEVEQISKGDKYFIIGRKGTGKTALCEYFNKLQNHNVFSERLSFKQFPFNELYMQKNKAYSPPNEYITIWKYLIYSTVCRLMLKNEAINPELRSELNLLFDDDIPLNRRVKKLVGNEFGLSLFGFSLKFSHKENEKSPFKTWHENVDYLEDLLRKYISCNEVATYYILFDELDEDYREVSDEQQRTDYLNLIKGLFKAVQDVCSIFQNLEIIKLRPVVFLRDDIYDLLRDNDKTKWGDFKVDLNWNESKIKNLLAFRISRAINSECKQMLSFEDAWVKIFGKSLIASGNRAKNKTNTFEYITKSTLLRPRDFVAYIQSCAEYALDAKIADKYGCITPNIVRAADKAFSNYLRNELTDELCAIIPEIDSIFNALSQVRKWNFSINEFEKIYLDYIADGLAKERNIKELLSVLFMFDVIGNNPKPGYNVFRYKNREARINFHERIIVHRGLFKSLQIL